MMIGAGAYVFVRNRKLMVRALSPLPALYRGFELHPDDGHDPYVFRLDLSAYGMGSGRMVFSQNACGETDRLHFELMPITLTKASLADTSPGRSSLEVGHRYAG
jgi:hypothetical protein